MNQDTMTYTPEDIERAREICEPLLYQRPCTGDDIENPGLLLWRRDYDKLCERIASALAAERARGREEREINQNITAAERAGRLKGLEEAAKACDPTAWPGQKEASKMEATEQINRIAVVNLLVRVHAALRSVDAADINIPVEVADRVSDAIDAIEEFARSRGISEITP